MLADKGPARTGRIVAGSLIVGVRMSQMEQGYVLGKTSAPRVEAWILYTVWRPVFVEITDCLLENT